MAVWEQLEVSKAHVAYACVGIFSAVFSLVSLFIKEKLYIGESTVAGIFGLIVGPHCLGWFNPLKWGNSDSITLEITRIVLCLLIFAVAVELPRKYMKKHWLSVIMLLLPVMTTGWLVVGLFIWIVIPGLNFADSLLVSACITATDPILAQSVVSGKFAQRVPGHLRNLLSAESGCNDGMAFPFLFLAMNLIIHPGNGREIVKDWICVTILYECVFGCILGVFIGYVGRVSIRFAEERNIIDRESFLAFYVVLSFCCAGFGSILGVDDLLVSFAAGTAFAWDGWFTQQTEETKISTVIDLLLNYAYFIFFGSIIPWSQFNSSEIGCDVWRLIVLSIVVIFLRRIPAVLILRPFIPDIKSWREAVFVGHFGPIGVGAVFAAILARAELESSITEEPTPLKELPEKGTKHWQLISCIWPITCFFIVTSIIVHGSSVAVITLGRHLNSITLTKTFTTHTMNGSGKSSWMQRLPSLDTTGRSFSLHRVDTQKQDDLSRTSTVETSGVPVRPVGGMKRRKHKSKAKRRFRRGKDKIQKEIFGSKSRDAYDDDELNDIGRERLQREKEARAATFALGSSKHPDEYEEADNGEEGDYHNVEELAEYPVYMSEGEEGEGEETQMSSDLPSSQLPPGPEYDLGEEPEKFEDRSDDITSSSTTPSAQERKRLIERDEKQGKVAYVDGNNIIIENRHGEIIDHAKMQSDSRDEEENTGPSSVGLNLTTTESNRSDSSFHALKKILTPTSLSKMRSLVEDIQPEINRSSTSNSEGTNDSRRPKHKYHAYKMDDLLIIENEEGDVMRTYKINRHHGLKRKESPSRDGGVVLKALSAVGILSRVSSTKSKTSNDSAKPKISDTRRKVEQPRQLTRSNRVLTPAPGRGTPPLYEQDEDSEEEDISLNSLDSNSYGEEGDASDSAEDVEDEESETEFERRRRLNALGHIYAPTDKDDEEEPPERTAVESSSRQTDSATHKVKSKLSKTLGLK
ncbi:Nha1p KNAG_0A02910 [Huiozyma naganishii CBS 8797]|uniref:Cation/H+ exchanger domain-containing protein n=1 Tax=Huiozyma naganishii (strain ATCC MYA-139 / BCRC 22969 / CBS 8797 / KCTC 17520 / NBRC 10181 / NCYC 3082 / Yp74L-3) TaxID=1071383 RepID=J7QZS0_HUIN7|nr:hypothetical protein KNAG_0A02910 [Kazachstania naganishii CBS 8797]CCK67980.1 hypothetical protein KNAG_0A02910 [Kazachstania naganishii CBS 8797]